MFQKFVKIRDFLKFLKFVKCKSSNYGLRQYDLNKDVFGAAIENVRRFFGADEQQNSQSYSLVQIPSLDGDRHQQTTEEQHVCVLC